MPVAATDGGLLLQLRHALAKIEKLEDELEATKCAVCLDAARCTALLPCRHLALCSAPACFAMLGAPQPLCPVCREPVLDSLTLFV